MEPRELGGVELIADTSLAGGVGHGARHEKTLGACIRRLLGLDIVPTASETWLVVQVSGRQKCSTSPLGKAMHTSLCGNPEAARLSQPTSSAADIRKGPFTISRADGAMQ